MDHPRKKTPGWQVGCLVLAAIPIGLAVLACLLVGLAVFGTDSVSTSLPEEEFRQWTNLGLPATTRDLRCHQVNNGLDGSEITFYFRCSPEDTGWLINTLHLAVDKSGRPDFYFSRAPFENWPNSDAWQGRLLYRGDTSATTDPNKSRITTYRLCTDAGREQVYLYCDNY